MSYVVVAVYRGRPGDRRAIADLLRSAATASRQEAGCRDYQVHQRIDDPNEWLLYERYDTEEAYLAHQATDHFREIILGEVVPRLSSRDRTFYTTLD